MSASSTTGLWVLLGLGFFGVGIAIAATAEASPEQDPPPPPDPEPMPLPARESDSDDPIAAPTPARPMWPVADGPLRPAVAAAFYDFTADFEAIVPWFYTDTFNLVTIANGNLVDCATPCANPMAQALKLPMVVRATGQLATQQEIADDWKRIKNGGFSQTGAKTAGKVAQLYLPDAAIRALVTRQMLANAQVFARAIPGWADFPADGQLGVMSDGWAAGAGIVLPSSGTKYWPRFTAALKAGNWDTVAEEGVLVTKNNPGVVPRNAANKLLFENAAAVVAQGLDPAVLVYPGKAA